MGLTARGTGIPSQHDSMPVGTGVGNVPHAEQPGELEVSDAETMVRSLA
jgi:hypothetical protein